jgi:cell division protein FtsB
MRVVSVLIVFCSLLTAGFTFYPEWVRLHDMKRDLAKEKTRLEELNKQSKDREQEVRLLQNDPEYLEMIARDRLDLMKEGETIFRLSSAKPRS